MLCFLFLSFAEPHHQFQTERDPRRTHAATQRVRAQTTIAVVSLIISGVRVRAHASV